MTFRETVRNVFTHFQNLNLIVLMDDLRAKRVARLAWITYASGQLCPIAHGMPSFTALRKVIESDGYNQAGEFLGCDEKWPREFVEKWDIVVYRDEELLAELQEIYQERLADADAVQQVIEGPCVYCRESTSNRDYGYGRVCEPCVKNQEQEEEVLS
jgi:hypothetical protein